MNTVNIRNLRWLYRYQIKCTSRQRPLLETFKTLNNDKCVNFSERHNNKNTDMPNEDLEDLNTINHLELLILIKLVFNIIKIYPKIFRIYIFVKCTRYWY